MRLSTRQASGRDGTGLHQTVAEGLVGGRQLRRGLVVSLGAQAFFKTQGFDVITRLSKKGRRNCETDPGTIGAEMKRGMRGGASCRACMYACRGTGGRRRQTQAAAGKADTSELGAGRLAGVFSTAGVAVAVAVEALPLPPSSSPLYA